MLTGPERHLRLRFIQFVRYELLHISEAPLLFRRDHQRLIRMIGSMRLSGYLTQGQAAKLKDAAARTLVKALEGQT